MKLRKIFNLPNPEQTMILLAEVEAIFKKCAVVGNTERKEQIENQRTHDGSCPKCRKRQGIVDKIASVEGISNFRGNLLKINGRLAIETKPVNYCTSCQNEWVKFKIKTITDFQVMKVVLDYLSQVVRDPEVQKRYSWKLEAIEIFNGYHAEAIMMVQRKYINSLRYPLTLRQLRTRYESIYDKKQSHEKTK